MKPLTFFSALFLFSVTPALPNIIHVPADQPTIQSGINAASNGDTVLVAPGTYVENIDFMGKAITVKSESGAVVTVMDGSNPVDPDLASTVTFHSNEDTDSVLEGFTIMNGTGVSTAPDERRGGGIYCFYSSPTITDNIVERNQLDSLDSYGGGIYCESGSPAILDNVIRLNKATGNTLDPYDGQGGGICCVSASPTIDGNEIHTNGAYGGGSPIPGSASGGGILCEDSSLVLTNNFIRENRAIGGVYCMSVYGSGGGIYCRNSASILIAENAISDNETNGYGGAVSASSNNSLVIADNIITGNQGGWLSGGAIYCGSATIENNFIAGNSIGYMGTGGGISCSGGTISNNIIVENTADSGGGGISCYAATITNNIIMANSSSTDGGGIYCSGQPMIITNNTLHGNSATHDGGGLCCELSCSATITNTVFWNNTASAGSECFLGNSESYTIGYCIIEGGLASVYADPGCTLNWGPCIIDADPLFSDPVNSDFHITFNSPCRGSGSNGAPGLPGLDFEGDPRIYQGTVDIGADEFFRHLYCTGNFTPGGSIQGKIVGLPGTAQVGIFMGSGLLDPPMPTQWGVFYLEAPWLLVLLGSIPSSGILALPATIPTGPTTPYDLFLQAIVGIELTNHFVLEVR